MLQKFLQLPMRPLTSAAGMTVFLCLVSVPVASKRDVTNVCSIDVIDEYLHFAYRCKPDEFHTKLSCGEERNIASCSRDNYIAVHSASTGSAKSLTDCSPLKDKGCPLNCILHEANAMCLGKRRCKFGANDVSLSAQCLQSESAHLRPRFLKLIYTCVPKNVIKQLRTNNTTSLLHDSCTEMEDGTTKGANTPPAYRLGGQGIMADANSLSSAPASSGRRTFQNHSSNENLIKHRHLATDRVIPSSVETPIPSATILFGLTTGFSEDNQSVLHDKLEAKYNSSTSPSHSLRIISEWLWTWNYVTDNTEKVILYFLCGVCLGIILLLVVVILRLTCSSRKQETGELECVGVVQRMTDSSNSVKWRSAGSESSIGDFRALHGDDDVVEATTGRHNDHSCAIQPYHSPVPLRSDDCRNSPAETTQLKEENNYEDADGEEMRPAAVSDDSDPAQLRAQSLQRTTPYWIDGDVAPAPAEPRAHTLQPTRHYYR